MKKKGGLTVTELTDTLQRLQAEFENYRKRKEAESCRMTELAGECLVLKLLPIIDGFELAFSTEGDANLKKGFEMIYAQFLSILENEGLKEISSNEKFDPSLHEAIVAETTEKPSGTILEVFQKGYSFKGRVIRSARVKVAK